MTVTSSAGVQRARTVDKPWGHEEIFALVDGKFCGKVLHVDAGHSLSLQYHRVKEEVICVQRGMARVAVGERIGALTEVELMPGDSLHLPPGMLHRITAATDLVLLEASTTELDDVVRLADDYGRAGTATP
ncbi:MAG TPA: cupin domain-containing protein [Nocardioidaceae bacterium]|nr:cupin domain-containing protein [Nocardioidaceae bacterium]